MTVRTYLRAAGEVVKTKGIVGLGFYVMQEIYRVGVRQLIFSSFSQNWEDLEVEKLLKDKPTGFYIDIGSNDPIRLNNTYRFYKQGWRGISVEPNPHVKSWFENIRPEDIFISLGVGKNLGEMKFYNFEIPSISTFSEVDAQKSKKEGYKLKEIIRVAVITPQEIYKRIPDKQAIDFISIDTEGWDYDIMQTWDFKKYPPRVICVEREKTDTRMDKLLNANGYIKASTNKINSLYIRIR